MTVKRLSAKQKPSVLITGAYGGMGRATAQRLSAMGFKRIVNRVEARSIEPVRIANRIIKILNKKTPRFAYSINRNPLLRMLNALPKRLQLWILKQVLKN